MSHDLKQSFTMLLGFAIGFSVAVILMPSHLALATTSGIICGILAGAFFAQVNYGDVFWHVNHGDDRSSDRTVKPDRKKHSTRSISTLRFHVMTMGSNEKRKRKFQNERAYWISHLRAKYFIPGLQEQQGRRYQRRVKPREGQRVES